MAQTRPGSKRSEAAFDPDAEVIIEDPDLNGGRSKPRSSKKNSSIVMLDLSQSRLALYFLAAQASILVILLALILYFSSVLSNIRTLSQSVSDNLQISKNVLETAQKSSQVVNPQDLGVLRYKVGQLHEEVQRMNEEPPKRRRPKPS